MNFINAFAHTWRMYCNLQFIENHKHAQRRGVFISHDPTEVILRQRFRDEGSDRGQWQSDSADAKTVVFREAKRSGTQFGARLSSVAGFTLLELLVSTAVFMMLVVVLAVTLNQALGVWSRNENKSDLRENARAAINIMASELRQAVVPLYRDDQRSLQMVINPAGVSYKSHDSIFWQAPIATSRTMGDLAAVGYFVRRVGNTWKLCRLFVNPDDTAYTVYTDPQWVEDSLLDSKAPATEATDLAGIFLDNVPGMWVKAYDESGIEYPAYDSRVAKKLPARIEISLVLLDKLAAARAEAQPSLIPEAGGYPTATAYLNVLPDSIRPNAQIVTINVSFQF